MTTTANIPGNNSNAMVPILTDNGTLLAWLLLDYGLHTASEWPLLHRGVRPLSGHTEAINTLDERHAGASAQDSIWDFAR